MNAEIIKSLNTHSKAIRDRKDASAADREGAYFIEQAAERLAGADKKRTTQAKVETTEQGDPKAEKK